MCLWSVAPYLSQCLPMPPKLRGLEIQGNSFFVVIFFDQRHVVNLHAAARRQPMAGEDVPRQRLLLGGLLAGDRGTGRQHHEAVRGHGAATGVGRAGTAARATARRNAALAGTGCGHSEHPAMRCYMQRAREGEQ